MADYTRLDTVFPNALAGFDTLNWAASNRTATQVRFVAADGSITVISGAGFAYSGSAPIAGLISGIVHYLPDGTTQIEHVSGLALSLMAFRAAIASATVSATVFAGDDVLAGGSQNDSLSGWAGNDTLSGGAGADVIAGGGGVDTLRLDLSAVVFGGDGAFDFSRLTVDPHIVVKDGTGGLDTLSGLERVEFFGTGSADTVIGSGGNDRLVGNAGWDRLDGLEGNDSLSGGAGYDVLFGGSGDDNVDGGAEFDRAGLRFASAAVIDLGAVQFLASFALTVAQNGTDQLSGIEAFEMVGSGFADTLVASSGNDALFGGGGNDLLSGGLGDDEIWLGAGQDTFAGGAGNDAIRGDFSAKLSGVNLDFHNFAADAAFTLAQDGEGGADQISGMNWVNLTLTGLADTLVASAGNDSINAGAGNNLVDGGDGDDRIFAGIGNDTVFGGAGRDTIDGFGGDDVITDAIGACEANGGAGNDLITGSAEDDRLFGDNGPPGSQGGTGTGNDTVDGGGGNDLIWGDLGNDLLMGGDGDDRIGGGDGGGFDGSTITPVYFTIRTDTGADVVDGGAGTDLFVRSFDEFEARKVTYIFKGIDEISYFTLGGAKVGSTVHVENLIISLGAGNDVVVGSIGYDSILGGVGNDSLRGGTGVDQLFGGTGDDTLRGEADGDNLQGGTGNDALYGGDGDDRLEGTVGGADTIYGGAGIDEVVFRFFGTNTTVPTVFSLASANPDHPQSIADGFGGTVRLFEIEKYRIIGAAGADGLTGSFVQDVLEGWAGADSLSGGAGDDRLYGDRDPSVGVIGGGPAPDQSNDSLAGGTGNDQLFGGNGDDDLNGGSGSDSLYGGLGSDSILGGDGIDYAEGSDGDDTLVAGAGNDSLFGGAGNDSLLGGAGDDVFELEAGDDVLQGGLGDDQLTVRLASIGPQGVLFSAATVAAGIGASETTTVVMTIAGYGSDTVTGINGFAIYGTAFNDTITGTGGDDRIFGFGGTDVLNGGAGDDLLSGNGTLSGGAGDDRFDGMAFGAQRADGGAGNDIASYLIDFDFSFDSVIGRNFNASAILKGGAIRSLTDSVGGVTAPVDRLSGIEGVIVNTWWNADTIAGSAGNDSVIQGIGGVQLNGADWIRGLAGNDSIQGSYGNDTIDGGMGTDLYDLSFLTHDAMVNLGGAAGLQTSGDEVGSDQVTGIEDVITGAGNDSLTGNAAANSLDGGAGNDALRGGGGADRFVFGKGADVVLDFTDNIDTLVFHQEIWTGPHPTAAQIVALASVVAGDTVFDFGSGVTLTVKGVTTTAILADDIAFL